MINKALRIFIVLNLILTTAGIPVMAQELFSLPKPGTMVDLSPAYVPALVKGLKVYPDNPLRFDFILDTGNAHLGPEALKAESSRLIKYFLASLTIPEQDLWVNLSPYEKNRIVPQAFGRTQMGQELLAQDYLLKQVTASIVHPQKDLGKKFWEQVKIKAQKLYPGQDIALTAFNKVWIVPQTAEIYAKNNVVYIVQSRLKVMLEDDYRAMEQSKNIFGGNSQKDNSAISALSSSVVRDVVLPAIEQEVNEGEHFASLRQIYHSLILAVWFKQNLQYSILTKFYIDKNKIAGVDTGDTTAPQKIYERYLAAFKKGAYRYIGEDVDPLTNDVVPHQYFSGGADFHHIPIHTVSSSAISRSLKVVGTLVLAAVLAAPGDSYGQEGGVDTGLRQYLIMHNGFAHPQSLALAGAGQSKDGADISQSPQKPTLQQLDNFKIQVETFLNSFPQESSGGSESSKVITPEGIRDFVMQYPGEILGAFLRDDNTGYDWPKVIDFLKVTDSAINQRIAAYLPGTILAALAYQYDHDREGSTLDAIRLYIELLKSSNTDIVSPEIVRGIAQEQIAEYFNFIYTPGDSAQETAASEFLKNILEIQNPGLWIADFIQIMQISTLLNNPAQAVWDQQTLLGFWQAIVYVSNHLDESINDPAGEGNSVPYSGMVYMMRNAMTKINDLSPLPLQERLSVLERLVDIINRTQKAPDAIMQYIKTSGQVLLTPDEAHGVIVRLQEYPNLARLVQHGIERQSKGLSAAALISSHQVQNLLESYDVFNQTLSPANIAHRSFFKDQYRGNVFRILSAISNAQNEKLSHLDKLLNNLAGIPAYTILAAGTEAMPNDPSTGIIVPPIVWDMFWQGIEIKGPTQQESVQFLSLTAPYRWNAVFEQIVIRKELKRLLDALPQEQWLPVLSSGMERNERVQKLLQNLSSYGLSAEQEQSVKVMLESLSKVSSSAISWVDDRNKLQNVLQSLGDDITNYDPDFKRGAAGTVYVSQKPNGQFIKVVNFGQKFYLENEIKILKVMEQVGIEGVTRLVSELEGTSPNGQKIIFGFKGSGIVHGRNLNSSNFSFFPDWQKVDIYIKVARILAQMHAKQIIHNDVKNSNILINDDRKVLLIDFSHSLNRTEKSSTPDLENNSNSPERGKTDKSDVYALGRAMGTGLYYEILNPDLEPRSALKLLISRMKDKNPQFRPSMSQVVEKLTKIQDGLKNNEDMASVLQNDGSHVLTASSATVFDTLKLVERSLHAIGDKLDNYPSIRAIKRGGVGYVYVRDDGTFIKFERDVSKRPYIANEIAIVQAMQNAGISGVTGFVAPLEAETSSGQKSVIGYKGMGLAGGKSLDSIEKTISAEQMIDIYIKVAEILENMHQHGFIHNDSKNSNILVNENGEVLLIDFSHSIRRLNSSGRITDAKELISYPQFDYTPTSPEMFKTSKSDVYSLGHAMESFYFDYDFMPQSVKQDFFRVLDMMIQEHPDLRPNMAQIIHDLRQIRQKISVEGLGTVDLTKVTSSSAAPGGIDLNPAGLSLKEKGQQIDFDVPLEPKIFARLENMSWSGVTPVILQITPLADLQAVLGLK